MKITTCKVNRLSEPLGFALYDPAFSWIVEESASRQQSARIVVKSGEKTLRDTGWTDLDPHAAYLGRALTPRTRYEWTVAVRADDGTEAESGPHFFETGKMNEPWAAEWIGCDNAQARHPVFSKKIRLRGEVKSARLYICGLGLYEAHIGGMRVGNEYLTPYSTDYNAWVQAQTYDVTQALRRSGGEAELRVHLGNGWYKGRYGFRGDAEPFYGKEWKLIAELHAVYADGEEDVFGTDESWTVTRSAVTFSNIYDGEHRDDTLPELPAERAVRTDPPQGCLRDRLSPPVVIREVLPVKQILHTPAGETVLDMGQNFTGSFRYTVRAKKGAEVRLQVGEILQNGCFYRDNLRSARAEYRYVSDGTVKTIQPYFTFYGYRYVKIEGADEVLPGDFIGLALYSDLDVTARIKTGHALFNRFAENVLWGQKGNFLDVPTDCPQRDERMGWTGDAQVFAPTACYQMDSAPFYAKFMEDVLAEQKDNGGLVPMTVPSFSSRPGTSAAWGDAACVIPMTNWLFYRDRELLERQYESMKLWIGYIRAVDGEDHGWRRHFHFGDWLALDGPGGVDGVEGGTEKGFIADAYYLDSVRRTREAAAILGEDTAEYRELEASILAGIREEYFSPAGRCCIDTQTAHLLTLRHGLSPKLERAAEGLLRKLAANKGRLQTGFVGTPLLLEELSKIGRSDLAYDLLLNEEYPGWLHEVLLGATTVWERWNSVNDDGSISSTGMNSLNHYAYGSVMEWVWSRCAGFTPLERGFRRIRFAPEVDARLGWMRAEFRSASGVWESSWTVEGESLSVCLTVPFGCEAVWTAPSGYMEEEEYQSVLGPGVYEFILKKIGKKD
jgi:alpha-L-rhamnosidase